MWNFSVDDEVAVCGDDGACRAATIIAADEAVVTVRYEDGTEEVFGQDAPELQKRVDAPADEQ